MPTDATNTRTRLKPDNRRELILAAAVTLADRDGYVQITRDGVAKAAGVSAGLVTRYFFCSTELRRCIMERAIDQNLLGIVAQGLAVRDALALSAPAEMRAAAAAQLGA
jgi:AcrR family transcriptional regulator